MLGIQPHELTLDDPLGKALSLPPNIRLAWKSLAGTNTLAFSLTKEKSFLKIANYSALFKKKLLKGLTMREEAFNLKVCRKPVVWRHDIQHKYIQHNDTQHDRLSCVTGWTILSITTFRIECSYAWYQYAECLYSECRYGDCCCANDFCFSWNGFIKTSFANFYHLTNLT